MIKNEIVMKFEALQKMLIETKKPSVESFLLPPLLLKGVSLGVVAIMIQLELIMSSTSGGPDGNRNRKDGMTTPTRAPAPGPQQTRYRIYKSA